ncbi:MAG TPA: hypothetical protein VJ343_01005 [archaeon]|nr:hypothetical protein [archaeon]
MPLTLADITPIGMCLATQDLFDAKRFQSNFCDNLLLRARDKKLEPSLNSLKRELSSIMTEKKFLDGHKTAIISNIDKIIGLVSSRYSQVDMRLAEGVVANGRDLIEKVMFADNFEQIARLEPSFKTKVTLPVYELFMAHMKRSKISVI